MNNPKIGASILKSPVTILVSVAAGILLGIFYPAIAKFLAPFGQMYLYFLQMCVIPILITAIASSIGSIIQTEEARSSILKLVMIFIIGLFVTAGIGVFSGALGRPGVMNSENFSRLGSILKGSQHATDLEVSLSGAVESAASSTQSGSLVQFLLEIVPANIFKSLSTGRALELVFFSIIFGIAIGVQDNKRLILASKDLFNAFQKIINWALYGLPFGLVFLLSAQIADVGLSIVFSMGKFILIFYIAGMVLFLLTSIIIVLNTKMPTGVTLKAMLDPVIISLATRSSFAALPSAIDSLEKKLGYDAVKTNLILPLGITVCRYGNTLYFGIAAFFVAQLYSMNITLTHVVIIFVGSVFAGMATAGSSGILTLAMMSIILDPLGLPLEAVLILFIAIDPIVDPMRTVLIVHTNMGAATFLAQTESPAEEEYSIEGLIKVTPVILE
ncbi:MAG TPA: cation:dicarboxylase symporter family transporter [Spirochaetota bacterium]|nr:cation:dicarboxylase symporter family transporter [Spirochaetota bacterium]HPS87991.1 cation:dicarboxylase symporter family transporter [Spirochaetota bacterium]